MSLCDLAPAHVRAIAPYQPGKPISELARELGMAEADIVKLASNENPLGPSPLALEAAQASLQDMAIYPDGAGFALKAKLSTRLGVAASQIVLGNGSNDVLDIVASAFLAPGTSSVHSEHAFAVYPIATQTAGAEGIVVPARDYGHDLEAMRAAIRDDTRVVWIANPNNPTGTFLPWAEIEAFLESVSPEVLVVLDEAYGEYLPEADRCDTVQWLARFPNLLITRTFSKAYGLAGLRVGYGLGQPDVIDLLNRVRHPFNVNLPALAAAEAALDDSEFLARSYALNRAGMVAADGRPGRIGHRDCAVERQFPAGQGRRCSAGEHRTAQARRDRAPGRRLRPAAIPARVGWAGGAERALPRSAERGSCRFIRRGSPGAAALEPRPDPSGRRAGL
jgi:histidinol-phosphate aminotransferase